MTCPPLEAWLEAVDTGVAVPDGGHLDCDACRATEASARQMLQALRLGVPRSSLSDAEFVARIVARAPARRGGFALLAARLMAAAAMVLALYPRAVPEHSSAPVARGNEATPSSPCEAALVTSNGLQFLRDGDHVPVGSRLAFRVRRPAGEARWLGIFGATAQGRVGWYHPAYETRQDDPQTLAMPITDETWLLSESVALMLGEGPVRIVCWQANHSSSVRAADAQIEAALSHRQDSTGWLRIESLGGDQASILLWFDSPH